MMGLLDNFDLGGAAKGLFDFIAMTNPEIREERAQAEERKRQAERQRMADEMARQQFEMQRAQFEQQRGLLAQQQADDGLLKRGLLLPEMEGARPVDGMGPGAPVANKGIDPQWFLNQGGSVGGLGKALEMNRALFPSGPKPADALAKINPADYTPESFREFMQSGDAGRLVPYRKPDDAPSGVREYEFARSQGYKGTFEQWVKEKAKAGAAGGTSITYSTPVAAVDAQGNPVFIRTTKDGLAPAIIPGVRPPKSANEEQAERDKKTAGKQAQQMVDNLNSAEQILREGRATGSGVGSALDSAGRLVGVSTKGAQDAARLEALSGWLVANVPRMEGPQSNYDVQNYITMAGKIGDRTTPIAERMAALQEVRKLQTKYAHLNGTPIAEQPETPKVRRYNPQTGRIE